MKPNNRDTFKQYCLRKLGEPVIQVNVANEQVEDRIDEALLLYMDYHYDGTEKQYYKHQLTQEDIDNQYITLPENIIGAVHVFPVGNPLMGSDDLFNIQYQIALNDLYTLTSVSMVPYYMTMQHLGLIQEILVGQQPLRFNRHTDKLYIDMNWARKARLGQFLLIEAYSVLDPETYTDVWADRWLQNYATAKIKYQWGWNLFKTSGVTLPGGVTLNGAGILEEAKREIEELENTLINSYTLPPLDMIG